MEPEINSNIKKIAKGVLIVFIGTLISKIFSYFYRLIVARYFGPEAYGTLSLGPKYLATISL